MLLPFQMNDLFRDVVRDAIRKYDGAPVDVVIDRLRSMGYVVEPYSTMQWYPKDGQRMSMDCWYVGEFNVHVAIWETGPRYVDHMGVVAGGRFDSHNGGV